MKARTRSISGALMMLVIVPLFAGLLACMPEYVPLGNPERAREKVVRRHVDDEAMYMEDAAVFERVAAKHHETVAELILYAFARDTW